MLSFLQTYWTYLSVAVDLTLYSVGIYNCDVTSVSSFVNYTASDVKMSAFPFKVGDYNRDILLNYPGKKGTRMTLPYADDVIAFLFVYHNDDIDYDSNNKLAIDLLKGVFHSVQQHYTNTCFEEDSMRLIGGSTLYDDPDSWFGNAVMLPTVHLQTAGHTVGAAYYYQKHHVINEPDDWAAKDIYGVSVSAAFGSDVRFAGIIVMEQLKDALFVSAEPSDVAPTDGQKIRLLNKHNSY